MEEKKSFTYADAGVDIKRADEAKTKIKKLIESTYTQGVIGGFGHFGGCFSGKFEKYYNPILVSSTDSVGTKVKISSLMKKYDTIGIDIVHHCVNDIAVMGAEPLFFLDYIGLGKLEPGTVEMILRGLAEGCKNAGAALIAGETAEMPDIYNPDEFDLAGFIVGVVDKDKIIDGSGIKEGDVVVGFKSNGLHTNGYTLARKIAFEHKNWNPEYIPPELGTSIGDTLLTPHKLYLPVISKLKSYSAAKGFAHVTGGGIEGNLKRIFPDGLTFEIDTGKWETPPLFKLLQDAGNVETAEMYHAFNMGIGLICVVDKEKLNNVIQAVSSDDPIVIGEVIKGSGPHMKFD